MTTAKVSSELRPSKREVQTVDCWTNKRTGETVYTAPGLPPDDYASLERDGLLTRAFDDAGRHNRTVVFKPDDPRVIAFELTMNDRCRRVGIAPMFPDIGELIADATVGNA
jgi:hypothetical protein